MNNTVLPAQTSAAGRKWKTLTFTVQDATNKTRIKIEAQTITKRVPYQYRQYRRYGCRQDGGDRETAGPELEKITYTPPRLPSHLRGKA